MTPDAAASELQPLLTEVRWVENLARQLVGDPELAEDLAQEAWLSIVEKGEVPRSPRAWFGATLRNLLSFRLRSDQRREQREQLVAPTTEVPAAVDALTRVSEIRRVADAVVSLREPYRTAVLQRHFDGLQPADIAARTGVPVETVKTRLRRGLQMLRERLDHEYGGDGRSWALALAPLAFGQGATASAGTKTTCLLQATGFGRRALVGALLIVASWCVSLWLLDDRLPASLAPASAVEPTPGTPSSTPTTAGEPAALERELATSAADPRTPTSAASGIAVQGRVLDLDGRPVPGLRLECIALDRAEDARHVVSERDGSFRVAAIDAHGVRVVAADPSWVTVIRGTAMPGFPGVGCRVVVARPRSSSGYVSDADGRPVAGALIRYLVEVSAKERRMAGHFGAHVAHVVRTAADGTFVTDRAPDAPGLRVHVSADGFAARVVEAAGRLPLTIALERAAGERPPAPPAATGTIRGRVVDEAGRPLARVQLWLRSEVPAGFRRWTDSIVERMGREDHADSGFRPFVYSDERGAFAFEQVTPGRHELVALDVGTLQNVTVTDVETGGDDVVVRLDRAQLTPRFSGRVVDRLGRPVAGVSVKVCVDAFVGTPVQTILSLRTAPRTGPDGRFAFDGLAAGRTYFVVQGERILPTRYGRSTDGGWAAAADGRTRDVEVRVTRCAELEVQLLDPDEADAFALRASGQALPLPAVDDPDRSSVPIEQGCAAPLLVPLRASELVLLRRGEIVRTLPIVLTPERPNRLQF